MVRVLSVLIFIYVIALHSSMALMEFAAWSIALTAIIAKWSSRNFWFPKWKMLLCLFVAVFASLLLNPSLKPFFQQFGFMRWMILLYAFAWALELVWTKEFEQKLLKVWVVALSITSLYVIVQFLTGIDLIHPAGGKVLAEGQFWRPTGFFSQSLTLAYCMGISVLAVTFPSAQLKARHWQHVACVLGFTAVIVSVSRGAWVSLFAVGLFYFVYAQRRFLPWFLGGVALVIGLILLVPNGMNEKLRGLLQFQMDNSESIRIHLWRAYGAMFLDHPWFGVGLFQGDKLLPEYYERLGIIQPFKSHSHNVLLQWLAGVGIFGFLAYVAIICSFLKSAWKLVKQTPWAWSLFLAQMFLHIGSLTENNFFDGEVNHNLIFIWALVLMLERRSLMQSRASVLPSH